LAGVEFSFSIEVFFLHQISLSILQRRTMHVILKVTFVNIALHLQTAERQQEELNMIKRKHDTRWLAGVALMAAIVIVLANTPLGMVPLPMTKATTVHIPVILGAVFFGPVAGGVLGGVFGICSVISNTITPALTSFAFSPFMSTTGLPGALKALWISVGCRILVGLVSGWLWIILRKLHVKSYLSLAITGGIGSLCNTLFVMGSIYLLLADQYAQAKDQPVSAIFGIIMGVVAINGLPEALLALVLVTAIGTALLKVFKKDKD